MHTLVLTFLISLSLFVATAFSVNTSLDHQSADVKEPLQWLTLEQALEKNKKQPKKILIDVYTDWCGWCKRMDKQVYRDPVIVDQLNKNFYVVKLNAEQRESVTIRGTVFKYDEKYKAHALALSLLQGQMSFPSTVFLNEKEQVMQRVPGYFSAKDFIKVLDYISSK